LSYVVKVAADHSGIRFAEKPTTCRAIKFFALAVGFVIASERAQGDLAEPDASPVCPTTERFSQ
jgi:hypothetical protein